jgi:hypothetical protein
VLHDSRESTHVSVLVATAAAAIAAAATAAAAIAAAAAAAVTVACQSLVREKYILYTYRNMLLHTAVLCYIQPL